MSFSKRIFAFIIIFLALTTNAQHSYPDTLNANFTTGKISIDGKLNEPVWQQVSSIENFTQRELNFGQPSSEKTKVAIAYDDLALYIGVWCYQQENIHHKYMQRDFNYE